MRIPPPVCFNLFAATRIHAMLTYCAGMGARRPPSCASADVDSPAPPCVRWEHAGTVGCVKAGARCGFSTCLALPDPWAPPCPSTVRCVGRRFSWTVFPRSDAHVVLAVAPSQFDGWAATELQPDAPEAAPPIPSKRRSLAYTGSLATLDTLSDLGSPPHAPRHHRTRSDTVFGAPSYDRGGAGSAATPADYAFLGDGDSDLGRSSDSDGEDSFRALDDMLRHMPAMPSELPTCSAWRMLPPGTTEYVFVIDGAHRDALDQPARLSRGLGASLHVGRLRVGTFARVEAYQAAAPDDADPVAEDDVFGNIMRNRMPTSPGDLLHDPPGPFRPRRCRSRRSLCVCVYVFVTVGCAFGADDHGLTLRQLRMLELKHFMPEHTSVNVVHVTDGSHVTPPPAPVQPRVSARPVEVSRRDTQAEFVLGQSVFAALVSVRLLSHCVLRLWLVTLCVYVVCLCVCVCVC